MVDTYVIVAAEVRFLTAEHFFPFTLCLNWRESYPVGTSGRNLWGRAKTSSLRIAIWWLSMMVPVLYLPGKSWKEGCRGLNGQELVAVAVPAKDTVKVVEGERIKPHLSALPSGWPNTPLDLFRRKLLQDALDAARASGYQGTDDASLVERLGYQVDIYPGTHNNIKITTPEDIKIARALMGMPVTESQEPLLRTGLGYDVHPFEQGRPLYLGGSEYRKRQD